MRSVESLILLDKKNSYLNPTILESYSCEVIFVYIIHRTSVPPSQKYLAVDFRKSIIFEVITKI